jgi:hypothetical protein
MIAFPSLLETVTDPLSRHPEPSDVRRLSESLLPRSFPIAMVRVGRCARRCQRTGEE